MYPRASFLGLALELRQQIYGYLVHGDVDVKVVDRDNQFWREDATYMEPIFADDAKLSLPWLSLSQACRQTYAEMQDYTMKPAISPGIVKSNRTWELDLHSNRRVYELESLVWRQIPCPPAAAQVLVANLKLRADEYLKFWGGDGPTPLMSSLYQALNRILHCGPSLDPLRPLPEHMHIRQLSVNIVVDFPMTDHGCGPCQTPDVGDDGEPVQDYQEAHCDHHAMQHLTGMVEEVRSIGIFFGYLDRVQVVWGQELEAIEMGRVDGACVPVNWLRYGFGWGVSEQAEDLTEKMEKLAQEG